MRGFEQNMTPFRLAWAGSRVRWAQQEKFKMAAPGAAARLLPSRYDRVIGIAGQILPSRCRESMDPSILVRSSFRNCYKRGRNSIGRPAPSLHMRLSPSYLQDKMAGEFRGSLAGAPSLH
jgi:hypothetical protein